MITEAETAAERAEVQTFLAAHLDIEATAVPHIEWDELWRPTIAYIRGPAGQVVAAAQAVRSQIAFQIATVMATGMPLPAPQAEFARVMDRHRELELLAVDPSHRGQGLARDLVQHLENRLHAEQVRFLTGCVTRDLEVEPLREFYRSAGFTVLADGEPLPQLMGQNWIAPATAKPAFYFYKRIAAPPQ